MANLFSEYKIKNIVIKNRIVMPPMVTFGWSDNNGYVNEKHIKHYEDVAKAGTGLIIVEATCIEKNGRLSDNQLGIWSDDYIEGFSKITEACHKHGAIIFIQLHHAGINTPNSVTEMPIGPSDYEFKGRRSRAMSLEDIKYIQECFAKGAIRAKKAGFDGIELHGAHGYLLNQFVSPVTNKRADSYGGDIKGRVKFAVETLDMVIDAVSDDNFIINYRMGGNEPTIENGIYIAKELEKHGVDILHVSSGISDGKVPEVPDGFPNNFIVYQGTEIKKHVNVPVIVVNGIRTPEQAEYLIESNLADFTAIGKGHLTDPHWAEKAKNHFKVNECQNCKRCQWFSDGTKCPASNK